MEAYIIIAEDDPDDRMLLQTAMEDTAFHLAALFMPDGDAVIQHLSHCDLLPAALILGINMPKVSGLQVLQYLKSRPLFASIPVHMTSTSSTTFDQNRCFELGASSYTTKPGSYNEIVDWLHSIKQQLG